jgi:hypothetical protein
MTKNEDEMRSRFLEKVLSASGKAMRVPVKERGELGSEKIKAKPAANKKALTVWLNPAAIKQFKMLAAGLERTQEAVMAEALNLLFEKYREPEIA